MAKKLTPYQKELKLLNNRIKNLEKQGYTFDGVNIPRSTEQVKALRGKKLKELGNKVENIVPSDSIAPNNVDVIWLIRERIDDTTETINQSQQYDNNFYPFVKGSGQRRQGINGTHGGTHRTNLLSVFDEIVSSKSAEELQDYSEYLLSIQGQLADLVDWNNDKVRYTEDVQAKVTEAIDLLTQHDTSIGTAYSMSNLYAEISS